MLEKACAVFHSISKKYDPAHTNLYSERTHSAVGTTPVLRGRRATAQTQHFVLSVRPFPCRQIELGPCPRKRTDLREITHKGRVVLESFFFFFFSMAIHLPSSYVASKGKAAVIELMNPTQLLHNVVHVQQSLTIPACIHMRRTSAHLTEGIQYYYLCSSQVEIKSKLSIN